MIKRLLALITALTILLSMAVPAYAADGPCITANTVTTPQGSSFTLRITAQQFSAVGSVDFTVHYDADALTVTSTSNGNMINGSTNFQSVNTDIQGQVTVSAVTMDAFSDSGTLLYIYFDVAMDCDPKDYPLAITIGDAYGTDLMPLPLSSVDGKVTVTERAPEKHPFYIGSYIVNGNDYQLGDTFTMRLVNNNYYSGFHMASGDFTVKYDTQLFRLVSVAPVQALQNENAVYSINTDIEGTVLISYASMENVPSYELFDLEFTVIGNVDTYSYIQYTASDVYDEDLFAYDPNSGSQYVYLTKVEEAVDYPDMWLETPRLVIGQQTTSTLMLGKGADVAAGDFVVTYDPTLVRCVSVTPAPELSAMGGVVMVDDNFTDGTVEFPYINANGYDEEDIPLVQIVWEPLRSDASHIFAVPSGSMTYNVDFEPVGLDYIPAEACIFLRTVIDPICTVDGRTNYTCACGESIDEDPVPMLGHDITKTAAQAPTCTEDGWHAYESCTRGDYTTRVDIPKLGHDEVTHQAQVQTCLGIGWAQYVTCNRCDHSTYEELPALGHRTIISQQVLTDPLSINLEAAGIPFTLEDGAYYSNNHDHNSYSEMVITALYDCQVVFHMGVSSESGCDRLLLMKDGNTLSDISGSTSQTMTLSLTAGDTVTLRYQKDVSVNTGTDRGWAQLEYDFVMAGAYVEVPSETLEPDCVNAVVCSFCETVVKKALGHDEIPHEGQKPTCLDSGWKPYVTCSRCDYTTYETLPELGHDEIPHESKEVTCTDIGWNDYVTCSRCDYTTYEEIAALGHRTIISAPVLTDPLSLEFAGDTPFTFENGAYYSNNHMDNTTSEFYIRALHDCQLTIIGNVSSESNYDRLIVLKDGREFMNISGEVTGYTVDFTLSAGEVITVRYYKDGSAQSGQDRGWVQLQYEFVMAGGYVDAPSETLEPDCVNAVVCDYCQTVVKKELGHDEIPHDGQNPTCLDSGWKPYVTCSRCDYTTYETLPELGHDEIPHAAKEANCTDIGWNDYVTCSRCDYSTYEEIPALGHRTTVIRPVPTDPISVEAVGDTPFTLENGMWYSNNHIDNTISELLISALYDCTLTLHLGVSSEQNYDKLFIVYNNQSIYEISGEVAGDAVTLQLTQGEFLTVHYQKDGSAANGQDRGWFSLQYDFVMADGPVEVPSEELEPDCVNAVVCDYCHATVKEKIPHAFAVSFLWNEYHTACQAQLVCQRNCGTQATVDCDVADDRSNPRQTVHTATAEYDGYTFTDTLICENHRIRFLNSDGTPLTEAWYHYGETVEAPDEPEKPATVPENYVFGGWDKEVTTVTGSADYVATFILPYPRGDMNCDFLVTDDDALYLLRHTLFPSRYPLEQSGDLNGDSLVTDDDALYLLRHTLFPSRYPLN